MMIYTASFHWIDEISIFNLTWFMIKNFISSFTLIMLSVIAIWASLKKWYPALFLFLFLSPITLKTGINYIFANATAVVKLQGGLLIVFTCLVILINIAYQKEKKF